MIVGSSEHSVEEACSYVALERAQIPIEDHLIDYVCGYNDKNLSYFSEKSDVMSIKVE